MRFGGFWSITWPAQFLSEGIHVDPTKSSANPSSLLVQRRRLNNNRNMLENRIVSQLPASLFAIAWMVALRSLRTWIHVHLWLKDIQRTGLEPTYLRNAQNGCPKNISPNGHSQWGKWHKNHKTNDWNSLGLGNLASMLCRCRNQTGKFSVQCSGELDVFVQFLRARGTLDSKMSQHGLWEFPNTIWIQWFEVCHPVRWGSNNQTIIQRTMVFYTSLQNVAEKQTTFKNNGCMAKKFESDFLWPTHVAWFGRKSWISDFPPQNCEGEVERSLYIYIYSKYVCTLQYAYIHISIYMYIYIHISTIL